MISSKLKSRLVGTLLLVWGAGLCVYAWREAHSGSRFVFPGAAAFGPFLVASGLWVLIEAPPIPAREYTRLGRVLTALGAIMGLVFALYVMGWLSS